MVIIFTHPQTFVADDYIHPIIPRWNNIFREMTIKGEGFLISIKLVGKIQKNRFQILIIDGKY